MRKQLKSMDILIEKPLSIEAKTTCNGKKLTHKVKLIMINSPVGTFAGPNAEHLTSKFSKRWLLRIEGAPGQFYLSQFSGRGAPCRLLLDASQEWVLENAKEIIEEAFAYA